MLFKVAVRNIRRSVKDYAIYFVTLLIAITVFYAFNSISDQQIMEEISQSNSSNIVEFTGIMMGIFSSVVALVLGFLVIYANQLLIRRRKHEFGMYFTLGMRPGQVSRIILYETVLVGIVSLALGLGLGVVMSQFLSFATAALFGIAMPDYQFTFSMSAFILTLVCFAAIYVVVAIFNVFSIRRCKLIDLINADSKSQKVIIRNPWICLVLFIVSIGILGVAYWQLKLNGMTLIADDHFNNATVLMLVGTLLLFFSLSGFIVATLTHVRALYLKKLRPFTTRQIASKINTSFASVWVVCILLFFAITTFATGMALVDLFTSGIKEANPYDASVIAQQAFVDDEDASKDGSFDVTQTEAFLKENLEGWDEIVADSAQIDVYAIDMTYGDLMDSTNTTLKGNNTIASQPVGVIGLSQFNEACALQGKDPVSLEQDEYLVTNNMEVSRPIADALVERKTPIKIPGGTAHPRDEINNIQLYDFNMLSNGLMLVVPDQVIEQLDAKQALLESFLNIMFVPGSNGEEVLSERVFDTKMAGLSNVLTGKEMIDQAMGLRMLITYLALYIGLVLLVATAAVLAIQLLSLTIDSQARYRTLSRLGCDMRMLSRTLFAQVLLYFVAPLAVAVCHSAWTIRILSDSLFELAGTDLFSSILTSAGLVLVIYGGYLLITFFASRSIVKQGLRTASDTSGT